MKFCIALGDPNQAVFFGGMGIVTALVFANLGAAYGTGKSGVGIVSVAVLKPELIFKSIIPVIIAGILGLYGMIIAIVMQGYSKYNFLRVFFQSRSAIRVRKRRSLSLSARQPNLIN